MTSFVVAPCSASAVRACSSSRPHFLFSLLCVVSPLLLCVQPFVYVSARFLFCSFPLLLRVRACYCRLSFLPSLLWCACLFLFVWPVLAAIVSSLFRFISPLPSPVFPLCVCVCVCPPRARVPSLFCLFFFFVIHWFDLYH